MTAADPKVLADIERWLDADSCGASDELIGAGYQASVHLVNRPDGPIIVKEARSGAFGWLRRATLRREYNAYQRLADLRGIPTCFGLLHDRYLILEYIAGPSLRQVESELGDGATFFTELLQIIQEMHCRGVAHGDLKRKDNILVGPGEQPFVVDFGTAHFQPKGDNRFKRWLFGFVKQTDYNAWIKRKYRRDYGNISAQDQTLYRPLPLENVARLIRETWRRMTLRRLRKRLRSRR